jgi:hypothetical protein
MAPKKNLKNRFFFTFSSLRKKISEKRHAHTRNLELDKSAVKEERWAFLQNI